jgi:outer membrane protein insertion porin family
VRLLGASRYITFIFISLVLILFAPDLAMAAWQIHYQSLPENIQKPLLKQFPRIEKEHLNKIQMDEIIRWLHNQLQVDRALFVEESPSTAKIEVQRIPRIGQINFSGLSALSESEARSYLSLGRNDPYEEQLLLESGERLRQAYKELGYLSAEIDVDMPTNERGQLVLNFKVRENKRTEITEIQLETANTDLKFELGKKTRSYKGKTFTDSTLNDLAQTLHEKLNEDGRYLTELIGPEARFNADETQVELFYKLNKIDKFDIDFKGNQAYTKNKLLDDVLDLKNYNSANPNITTELTQKLKTFYLQEGFARVEVHVEELESFGPYSRRLLFLIDEGARIKIDKYVFTGKFTQDPTEYGEFIRKNSSPMIKKDYYVKEDLDKGFANLLTYLRNQGRLLAKIVSTRTQYNRAKDKITVYINLDEGPITVVDSIEFTGNAAFPKEQLLKILDLEPDQPLRLNKLEQAVQDIKTFYAEKGYIEMRLLNEKEDLVIYNADNTRAQLKFNIFEGPLVTVNSIVLDGNYFTKDYVILNELDLKVGETVTPSKVEESISRLQRVGHFSSVEIKTLEEKTIVAQRTLLVRVTERDPGVFTMGFGATNERTFTLRGFTGIGYRNLFGTGRGLSLRLEGNYNVADIKYLENKVTVGYLEPYLFDTRVRGRINVSRSKTVTDYDLRKASEVNQATTSIEKDFTSHITATWDLLSVATVRDFPVDSLSTVEESLVNIASTGPTVDWDYRDSLFNPTRGTFTRISAEYASPGLGSSPTIEYWRAQSTFKHYLNLAEGPWVWANSFRLGFLENLSSRSDGGVPYDKKGFILGGESTLRGYEAGTSEVFPSRFDLGTDDIYLMKTRAKMGLIKTELRFPLWGAVGGAVFYDGGYVEIEGLKFADYYRDTVGFGLRYNTPVGPLNLEFGWKLDRRENEEPWRFHLSIGAF